MYSSRLLLFALSLSHTFSITGFATVPEQTAFLFKDTAPVRWEGDKMGKRVFVVSFVHQTERRKGMCISACLCQITSCCLCDSVASSVCTFINVWEICDPRFVFFGVRFRLSILWFLLHFHSDASVVPFITLLCFYMCRCSYKYIQTCRLKKTHSNTLRRSYCSYWTSCVSHSPEQ